MKIVLVFLMTVLGIPFICYGDEIGMNMLKVFLPKEAAVEGPETALRYNRSMRKRMAFSDGNSNDLYLPSDSDQDRPTVEDQM